MMKTAFDPLWASWSNFTSHFLLFYHKLNAESRAKKALRRKRDYHRTKTLSRKCRVWVVLRYYPTLYKNKLILTTKFPSKFLWTLFAIYFLSDAILLFIDKNQEASKLKTYVLLVLVKSNLSAKSDSLSGAMLISLFQFVADIVREIEASIEAVLV